MDNLSSCDLCTHQKCLELYNFVQILFNIFWERIPMPIAIILDYVLTRWMYTKF